MNIQEAFKQLQKLQGTTQLYELLIDFVTRVSKGEEDVYSKELGENKLEICEDVVKHLTNKLEEVKTAITRINNSEVHFAQSSTTKSTGKESIDKGTTGKSGNTRGRKSKQTVHGKD